MALIRYILVPEQKVSLPYEHWKGFPNNIINLHMAKVMEVCTMDYFPPNF